MAVRLAEAFISITGRTTQFERDVDRAQGVAVSKVRELQGVLAAFSAAGAAVAGAGFLVNMAADAEETRSKFETVFRDISGQANDMADELRRSFGLGRTAARQLLGDTGDLLSGFGFTQEMALDLSGQVQKLAVDLASFTNFSGGAKGASEALTKALLGERESVKALGIAILEEDVKKKVAENTAKGLTFETERQAKAYATLMLAQEQSKNAIGDYARTSGSLANQMRLVRTRVVEAAESIGSVLLPPLQSIVPVLASGIDQFITMNETLGGLPAVAALAAAGIGALKAAMVAYAAVTGQSINMLRLFKLALIGTGIGALIVLLGSAVAWMFKLMEAIANTSVVQDALARNVEKFSRAWELVKESAGIALNAILSIFNNSIGGMANTLSGSVANWIDRIADFVLNAAQWLRVMVDNWSVAQQIISELGSGLVNYLIKLFSQLPEYWAYVMGLNVRYTVDAMKLIAMTVYSFFDNFVANVIAIIEGADIGEIVSKSLQGVVGKAESIGGAFAAGLQKKGLGSALDLSFPEENIRRVQELMGGLVDEKKALEMERQKVIDAAKEGGAEEAAVEKEISVKLKSGFLSFEDLGKKVQDALFKQNKDEVQVRIASATEAVRDAQNAQLSVLNQINSNVSGGTLAVASG